MVKGITDCKCNEWDSTPYLSKQEPFVMSPQGGNWMCLYYSWGTGWGSECKTFKWCQCMGAYHSQNLQAAICTRGNTYSHTYNTPLVRTSPLVASTWLIYSHSDPAYIKSTHTATIHRLAIWLVCKVLYTQQWHFSACCCLPFCCQRLYSRRSTTTASTTSESKARAAMKCAEKGTSFATLGSSLGATRRSSRSSA